MLQSRILSVCGFLLVLAALFAAGVYPQAFTRPAVASALVAAAILGTAAAAAGLFFRRIAHLKQAGLFSEKLLRDSEARFRDLFDMSPFPAVVTSVATNRVLAVNQRTSDKFGIPKEKAPGLHAPDFYVDPTQRERFVEQLRRHGHVEAVLFQLRTPSGEDFWADASARVLTFEGQQAILTVFHNVTERVAAEQALRASEQRLAAENKALTELTARQAATSAQFNDRLRDILETCSQTIKVQRVSMWTFEEQRSCIRCADLYEQGQECHSCGQLLQRTDYPAYFKALEEERLIAAADAHNDARTAEFSESYMKPLGIGAMLDVPLRQNDATIGVLCLEHVGEPRTWTADEQNFALSVANLIVVALSDARLKEAVDRLAQSEARARLLVDTAHDAFVGINSEGIVTMWNAQAVATFGWTREEAIGRQLADTIIPPGFREAHNEGMRKFLQSGTGPILNLRLELTALHRTGREFPIEITVSNPIPSGAGYFFGAFLRDISNRRQHEQELQRAKESAEAATRAKSEFLANMSHELRTPLNGVLGYSQLLQRNRSLTAEQRESIDAIAKCGAHLLELINDVLDLSKIEAGRIEMEPVPTDIHQLTLDLRQVIAEPARRKGLRFSVEIDPEAPARVVLDGRHLRQVLLNLLGNAVKFTDRGDVILVIGASEDCRLYFEVRDTGIGIEEENLQEIFQAFRQTRSGALAGGTGLGLAISRRLVASMGGELHVRSKPGLGSSFYFTLPLETAAGAAPTAPENSAAEAAVDSRLAPGQHITALVADDSTVNRRILTSLLESAGIRVIGAVGGEEAVALAAQHRPEVVLMDLRMGDLDGLQATRRILENPATASIPVIMVTASAFGDSRQAAFEAGCVDFISKPIRAGQLFQTLHRLLGVRFVSSGAETAETDDESALPLPAAAGDARAVGRRLREAASLGNMGELDALADELILRGAPDSALGHKISRLSATFDFTALLELAALMENRSEDSRAAT